MADEDPSISAIRERTTRLLADWGGDLSVLLNELEEKRARLQEREAKVASQSDEVEALNRRIEVQDTLIASLRSEADETAMLLKTSIDRHVTTISELQQSVAAWKGQYVALKSRDPAAEPASAPALPEPTEEEQQAPENAGNVSEDRTDATSPHNMRESLLEAQQMVETKK